MKQVFCILFLSVAVLSCKREAPEPVEHPFTQEELVKKHLDESFGAFFTALEADKIQDWEYFIYKNSSISLEPNGTIVYKLRQGSLTPLTLRILKKESRCLLEATLYGGISMEGRLTLGQAQIPEELPLEWNWCVLESLWDIDVYDNGVWVAKLGLESYAYTESGQYYNTPIPVLRFLDGTSYSLTTVLLVDPLMDYLLAHAISTE